MIMFQLYKADRFGRIFFSFFGEGREAQDVGVARILFYSYLFYFYFFNPYYLEFLSFANLPEVLWRPVSFFKFLEPSQLHLVCNTITLTLLGLSLLLCAVGLFFKWSSTVAFLTGIIVSGMPNNFGTIYDSTTLVCVVLGILPFSKASHFLSLDKKFGFVQDEDQVSNVWVLNLITTLIFFFYICSGIQKLRCGGWDYYTTHNLSMALVYMESPIGKDLAKIPWLEKSMKISGVILQLSTIIPLLLKRTRLVFGLIHLFFHLTIDLAMTIHFNEFKIIYVFMFPWHTFKRDLFFLFKNVESSPPEPFSEFKLKQKFLIPLTVFVFFMSCLSVRYYIHYWPFSTATMYAYAENYPYDEQNVYVLFKGEKDYQILIGRKYYPLDRIKTQILIRKYLKEGKPIEEIAMGVFQMLKDYYGEKLLAMEIRHCFYQSTQEMIDFYPVSKNCKLLFAEPKSYNLDQGE